MSKSVSMNNEHRLIVVINPKWICTFAYTIGSFHFSFDCFIQSCNQLLLFNLKKKLLNFCPFSFSLKNVMITNGFTIYADYAITYIACQYFVTHAIAKMKQKKICISLHKWCQCILLFFIYFRLIQYHT